MMLFVAMVHTAKVVGGARPHLQLWFCLYPSLYEQHIPRREVGYAMAVMSPALNSGDCSSQITFENIFLVTSNRPCAANEVGG